MRNLFLQASIVRAGGHQLMLPDSGWLIYSFGSYEEIYSFLLSGWYIHCRDPLPLASPLLPLCLDPDLPCR